MTDKAAASSPASFVSLNPATEEVLARFRGDTEADIDRKLSKATTAFGEWRRWPVERRAAILVRAAELLESEHRAFGELMTREMGKPIGAAREEAKKCAVCCRMYAERGPELLAPQAIDGLDQAVWFQPLGPVLAIMPWNFPFWQVFRFAAPALVAGNVAILKHASNVPQCALELERLVLRAGAPAGVFQTLLVRGSAIEGVIADDRIAAVTLTGSEGAGRSVAEAAGRHLKKTVLELGGSDAFVVLPSADLEKAAETAAKARTINNGQSCIAAKRFIVAAPVYDAFVEKFVAAMRALVVGDPMNETTEVGPLATAAIRDGVAEQVTRSVEAGARVLLGGERPTGRGFFYPPTILVDLSQDSPVWQDEVFGPVAAVVRVADAAEALRAANQSRFGLGASVWTRDRGEAEWFAEELTAGLVFANGMVASDARFPFGGVKASGYGRELGSYGLREFLNIKTVRLTLEPRALGKTAVPE